MPSSALPTTIKIAHEETNTPVNTRVEGSIKAVANQLSELFVELELLSPADGPEVHGSVTAVALGDLQLLRSTLLGGRFQVRRSAALVTRSSHRHYYICRLISGAARLRQGGVDSQLSAGDVALLDSSQPYVIEASGSIDALWVAVPRYRVDGRLPNPHEQLGQRICGSTGSGALASNLLLDAYHQAPQLPVGTATRIGNTLLDLLALALPAAEQPMASRASTRLQRALNYIEEHLCDPTLTAQRVASAQAMSTRYLNTLFQRKATSSARWIRLRRLERCRAELQSPGARNETVAAIALRCGFSDISTFNRAFKREYGLAPAALRSTTSPPLIKVNGNKKPRPAS